MPLDFKVSMSWAETDEFETDIKFSPKGNYVSFIRNQNIFVLNIKNGEETQLTKDGS